MKERCEIVYRMSADASIDGIEVHEVADVMYAFAEAVDEAMKLAGEQGVLKVNVRPFRQGSFVTEFVLTYTQPVVNLFSSPEGNALANILAALGFLGVSAKTVPATIRRVKGRIDKHHRNDDGTYTYGEGDDTTTVGETVHRIIQSPKVAKAYKAITVGPIVGINNSINVTIQSRSEAEAGDAKAGSRFDMDDVPDMEMYETVAVEGVPGEGEDIVSTTNDVVLSPQAGPYDGGKNGYTFRMGDQRIGGVRIHDPDFLLKIERGEVRLMSRDLIVADMETTQTIKSNGRVQCTRVITKVKSYHPFAPAEQLSLEGMAEEDGEATA